MSEALMLAGYIVGSVATVAGVAFRLRYRARRDEQRHGTLRSLIPFLPKNGVIDIHDHYGDGSYLRIRVTGARADADTR